MSKKTLKAASLLATGGLLLQFGGCGNFGKFFMKGFGEQVGGVAALAVETAVVVPLIGDSLAGFDLAALLGLGGDE